MIDQVGTPNRPPYELQKHCSIFVNILVLYCIVRFVVALTCAVHVGQTSTSAMSKGYWLSAGLVFCPTKLTSRGRYAQI